jgi:hypothetical protein
MDGMRRTLAVLAVGLAVACAYEVAEAAPAAPDPGKRLAAALLTAAQNHNAKAIWSLLSKPSRRRLGPTLTQFKKAGAPQIERALIPFETRSVKLFLDRTLTDRFGIVAMRTGAHALAFPLRLEQRAWKIETPGPIRIRIIGPAPGSRGTVSQVAFGTTSPATLHDAIVFVDGKLYPPNLVPSGRTATVYVTLPKALRPGVHIAVAYAEQGASVSALAWSFRAT